MTLYSLISTQPDLSALAAICAPTDAILLRQDAVYLTTRGDITWPVQTVYALQSDVQGRNIAPVQGIDIINDARWVELVAEAEQNILW